MLNPDDNLYSVAPVGNIVVVGRNVALKGGITRDNAINLLTWLILSTNATPDEIRTAIVKANRPTNRFTPRHEVVPVPVAAPRQQVPLAGQSVAAFMGTIDPEEQAALDEVKAACEVAATVTPTVETPPAPLAVVPAPVRTAAPVPTTPARPLTTPIVAPVAVNVPSGPVAPSSPASVTVDPAGVAKAWGVPS